MRPSHARSSRLAKHGSWAQRYAQAKTAPEDKAGFFAISSPPEKENGVIELLIKAAGGTAEQARLLRPAAAVYASRSCCGGCAQRQGTAGAATTHACRCSWQRSFLVLAGLQVVTMPAGSEVLVSAPMGKGE